ncbi:Spt20 family-domain-containing protein [Xylariaceae sp. FL1272]|nr:Spt20 family-domain-containing protein [Xylariaceae sp. FL1272]
MPPPVVTAVPPPAVPKLKRPTPAGIQTNGAPSSQSSPSPSISAKIPPAPATAKQSQLTGSATSTTPIAPPVNGVSASTSSTRPPAHRARRDTGNQPKKTSIAVPRSAGLTRDPAMLCVFEPRPKKLTQDYILRKYTGHPPSLVIHLHTTYFRFEAQESTFPYKSPMGIFLQHVRNATVPHGVLLEFFAENGVPFYEGCLIVQVHNHKLPAASVKDEARPSSKASSSTPCSIHNHSDYVTPSSWVPFPKREVAGGSKLLTNDDGEDKENPTPTATTAATVTTKVLFPTPESLLTEIKIKAGSDTSAMPPPTPMSAIPPTPTTSMPPPAKRQKRQKMELSGNEVHAFEGQVLVATMEPLNLEVPKNRDEAIALINQISDPRHSDPPPHPKTRKRTVAEKAADKALAEEEEKYMLTGDERLSSTGGAGQSSSGDADGSGASAPQFEARFERLNTLTLIKKEHAEKRQQERERQAENERKINLQKQQQAQAAQEQAEQVKQAQADQTRRDEAARKATQAAQASRDHQRRVLAVQAQAQAAQAASPHSPPNPQVNNMPQPAHGHPAQNGAMAGGQPSSQAQRFAQAVSQPAVSSPIVRQHTPQNMSSPMVGNVPMSQTNSGMGGSPARPPSVVQTQPPMSAAMAISMSARGSQQSHPSGTPRMPNATPQMPHATPINRPMATPRMTQASPPPGMMVTNSPMNPNMMMGHPNNMGQPGHNPMMAAQIAAQQHQQQMQQRMMMQQQAQMRMNGQSQQMSPQMQQQQILQQQMARQMQAMQMQNGGMMTPQQQHQQQQQILQQYQATLQQQTAHMQGQVPGQPHPGNPNFTNMNGMNMGMQQPMQQSQLTQAQVQQIQQMRLRAMQMQQQGQVQAGNMPQMPQQIPPQIQQQIRHRGMQIMQSNIGTVAQQYGGEANMPREAVEKFKQQCVAKAHQEYIRRQLQQQSMMQQQQAQQQAQQH